MYYFIINPNSRSGAGRQIWEQVEQELKARRESYECFLTEYVGHATKIAAQISSKGTLEKPVHLIAMGGDGTINEVLTGIEDLDTVIFGYIPTGSGNDFCRGMQLPSDPLKALDSILAEERIMNMDVPYAIVNNRKYRFGISTGIGFDAAVCHEVITVSLKKFLNRLGLGKLVYLVVALKLLLTQTPKPMNIALDGDRNFNYKKIFFTAVMNQRFEGGGFMFCPKAKPDDGVLDVIAVEGINKLKLLCCLPLAFSGHHDLFKCVHIFRCKSVKINSSVPLPIHKDGESGGIQCELFVSLEPKTLKVIMPVL